MLLHCSLIKQFLHSNLYGATKLVEDKFFTSANLTKGKKLNLAAKDMAMVAVEV